MKYSAILFALVMTLVVAGSAAAQVSSQRVTFSEAISPAGEDVFVMTYVGPYKPGLRLYEATAIGSVDTCFENRTFSLPRGVDRSKSLYDWNGATSTYQITWTLKRENRDTCKVLFGSTDGRVDSADFLVWQRNLGSSALRSSEAKADDTAERTSDGSVRFISYSVNTTAWY